MQAYNSLPWRFCAGSSVVRQQRKVNSFIWIPDNSFLFIPQLCDLPLCSPLCSEMTRWHIRMLMILNVCMAEKIIPINFHAEVKVKTALDCGSWSCLKNSGLIIAFSEITKKPPRSNSYILFLIWLFKWPHSQKGFSTYSTLSLQLSKTQLHFLARIIGHRLWKEFYRSFGPTLLFYWWGKTKILRGRLASKYSKSSFHSLLQTHVMFDAAQCVPIATWNAFYLGFVYIPHQALHRAHPQPISSWLLMATWSTVLRRSQIFSWLTLSHWSSFKESSGKYLN